MLNTLRFNIIEVGFLFFGYYQSGDVYFWILSRWVFYLWILSGWEQLFLYHWGGIYFGHFWTFGSYFFSISWVGSVAIFLFLTWWICETCDLILSMGGIFSCHFYCSQPFKLHLLYNNLIDKVRTFVTHFPDCTSLLIPGRTVRNDHLMLMYSHWLFTISSRGSKWAFRDVWKKGIFLFFLIFLNGSSLISLESRRSWWTTPRGWSAT